MLHRKEVMAKPSCGVWTPWCPPGLETLGQPQELPCATPASSTRLTLLAQGRQCGGCRRSNTTDRPPRLPGRPADCLPGAEC